jgi:hypothetical protein
VELYVAALGVRIGLRGGQEDTEGKNLPQRHREHGVMEILG